MNMAVMDGVPIPEDLIATLRRSVCVPTTTVRNSLCDGTRKSIQETTRSQRILTATSRLAAAINIFFVLQTLTIGHGLLWIGLINALCAAAFLLTPQLYRFGELLAPLTFFCVAYLTLTLVCLKVGTGSGLLFYFVIMGAIVLLVLGMERLTLALALATVAGVTAIVLEFTVPENTGTQPDWAFRGSFVVTTVSAGLMAMATVWYALRENAMAQSAIQSEFLRSEALLANILPESIAQRLKDPERQVIADKYDDASILFADIAGYTQRASDTAPSDLVRFLDTFYTDLDALVDHHGLEKVKTSGDSYMVVSGIPHHRTDHLEALACLALDLSKAVCGLTDPKGRPVPVRIGIAAGPVVAGVVGARKFFYDVWGDAVNVASRMESTDVEGRIQVPHDVYERLRHAYVFEERGEIDVKGKGLMRTWYLVGRKS
jgi:adenylate cyclase